MILYPPDGIEATLGMMKRAGGCFLDKLKLVIAIDIYVLI
jgi:hypothetical protein